MSETSSETSSQGSCTSSSQNKKVVGFNAYGQPVGEHSAKLATRSGELVRSHVPICIEDWRSVPADKKDELWRLLLAEFVLPQSYKIYCLKSMSEQFRKYKAKLRAKYYDIHDNDTDRLRNCPLNVRQEDWVAFVKHTSEPRTAELRQKNAKNRRNLTIYHTCGRHSYANVAEMMKRERADTNKRIKRTDEWIKAHISKDGSISSRVSPHMNQGGTQGDLHNSSCQDFRPKKRSCLRRVGTTDSRTQTIGSAAALGRSSEKDSQCSEQTKELRALNTKLQHLVEEVEEISQMVKQLAKVLLNSNPADKPNETRMDGRSLRQESACELLYWGKKDVVAFGKVQHGCPVGEEDLFKVVLDIINKPDTPLYQDTNSAGTLGEVGVGGYTIWPCSFIRIMPQ